MRDDGEQYVALCEPGSAKGACGGVGEHIQAGGVRSKGTADRGPGHRREKAALAEAPGTGVVRAVEVPHDGQGLQLETFEAADVRKVGHTASSEVA